MSTDSPLLQLDVLILGREYRIACAEDERDALMLAVAHLDARMREIRDAGKVNGTDRIAVMAALNITNDLLRERKQASVTPVAPTSDGIDAPDVRRRIRRMNSAIESALDRQDKLF